MKGKRYTEQQIVRILQEIDGGKTVAETCRQYGVGPRPQSIVGSRSTGAWRKVNCAG